MPHFPELLYQLSARDQQVTWLDPFIRRVSVVLAAAQVEATLEVPDGQVLILQSGCVAAIPGGAQTGNTGELGLRPRGVSAGNQIDLSNALEASLAGSARHLEWSGSVIVPPEWNVVGLVNYSAGAVANETILMIVGILVPVGNIQRI